MYQLRMALSNTIPFAISSAVPAMFSGLSLIAASTWALVARCQLVALSRDDAGFGNKQRNVSVGIQHRY